MANVSLQEDGLLDLLRAALQAGSLQPDQEASLRKFCREQAWDVLNRMPENFGSLPRLEVSFWDGIEVRQT